MYERVRTAQHLHIFKRYLFKRYRNELRFLGEVPLRPSIYHLLSVGAPYLYQYQPAKAAFAHISFGSGRRLHVAINDGLATIMAAAKLDDGRYAVTDWFRKKGRLIVYVTKKVEYDMSQAARDEDAENRHVA